MLLDRSLLIGQKLLENAKIEKVNWDMLGDFQTLCLLLQRRDMFSDFLDSTIYNIREGSNRNQIELSIDGGASKSFPIYGKRTPSTTTCSQRPNRNG